MHGTKKHSQIQMSEPSEKYSFIKSVIEKKVESKIAEAIAMIDEEVAKETTGWVRG